MDTAKTETIHIARRLQAAKERLERFEQMTLTEEQAKVIMLEIFHASHGYFENFNMAGLFYYLSSSFEDKMMNIMSQAM